jgi:hypothetical protein
VVVVLATCAWSIDNETCASCNVVSDDYGYSCTEFDCTNTDGVDEANIVPGDSCQFGPVSMHAVFLNDTAHLVCPADDVPKLLDYAANVSNEYYTAAVLICALVFTFLSSF